MVILRSMASRNDAPFSVQVPKAGDDRPSWIKVGIIAVVGFAVGVAWPRVAGIRLGPTAPDPNGGAKASVGPEPGVPPVASGAGASASQAVAAAAGAAVVSGGAGGGQGAAGSGAG